MCSDSSFAKKCVKIAAAALSEAKDKPSPDNRR